MNNAYPLITIFIPTQNRKSDLLECLHSLQKLDYPKERLEIIVWDNCSHDGTAEAIETKFQEMEKEGWLNLQIIKSQENIGPYVPYNEALLKEEGSTEYILGIDDDVVLEEQSLKKMIGVVNLQDNVGIVGGCIVYYDFPDKTVTSAGFINGWLGKYRSLTASELRECDYVIGCGWLINRKLFQEIGGFDPDYFTMHWEMDFCVRAKKKGYKVFYQPQAKIRHKISQQKKRDGLYYLYRNKLLFIIKNAPFFQKITSLLLYSLFWPPKILIDSIIKNKGINIKEIKIILKAVSDGITGKAGKQDING
jgi:GT2 family glycosyltransferase